MLWLSGYASSLWFGLWLLPAFDSHSKSYPLFETYLAFLAALSLTVVTYKSERDREPRPRSHQAQLPPSRVV
jgi:hypothetical protein